MAQCVQGPLPSGENVEASFSVRRQAVGHSTQNGAWGGVSFFNTKESRDDWKLDKA
jgi:hypothetical protein